MSLTTLKAVRAAISTYSYWQAYITLRRISNPDDHPLHAALLSRLFITKKAFQTAEEAGSAMTICSGSFWAVRWHASIPESIWIQFQASATLHIEIVAAATIRDHPCCGGSSKAKDAWQIAHWLIAAVHQSMCFMRDGSTQPSSSQEDCRKWKGSPCMLLHECREAASKSRTEARTRHLV